MAQMFMNLNLGSDINCWFVLKKIKKYFKNFKQYVKLSESYISTHSQNDNHFNSYGLSVYVYN